MNKHTPGPWILGEYSDTMGYDCMTGGVRAGPVVLDAGNYGQQGCENISADALDRIIADARLIAAAPELLNALRIAVLQNQHDMIMTGEELRICESAISKATGEQ